MLTSRIGPCVAYIAWIGSTGWPLKLPALGGSEAGEKAPAWPPCPPPTLTDG